MSKAIINGYELEDDGSGSLILREKSTGETIEFDGNVIKPQKVDTPDLFANKAEIPDSGIAFDARAHFISGSFNDIGEAINDLASTIVNNDITANIVVPRSRSGDPKKDGSGWLVETPISVPYVDSTVHSGISITTPSGAFGSVALKPNFSSPNILFKKEPQSDTSDNQTDQGFQIAGFHVFDSNDSVTKFVEINDTDLWKVENCEFIFGANTTTHVDVRTPNRSGGTKFGFVDNCTLNIDDGTALQLYAPDKFATVSDVSIEDLYVKSPNDGTGTAINIERSGRFKIWGGDIASVNEGIRLRGENVNGHIYGVSFEGGYGEGSSVVTPFDIGSGVESVSIDAGQRHDVTRRVIRHSNIRISDVTFMSGPKAFVPVHAGGQGFDPRWSPAGTNAPYKDESNIVFQTGSSSNDESRLETGGGPAAGMISDKDIHRWDTHLKLNDTSNVFARKEITRGQNNRVQLIADPSNSTGEGITANWMARILRSGSNVTGSPVDTGVPIDTNIHLFSIISEDEGPTYDWRFCIDDEQVALIEGVDGQGSSGFRLSMQTKEAAQKSMEVYESVPKKFETFGRKTLL